MISFQVESRRIDTGEKMVTVIGEIDLATAPAFARALQQCRGNVVVDLRRVPFMDTTGLRVLIIQQNRLVEAGGSLRLLVAGDHIRRLINIAGLAETFRIDDSIHPAEKSPMRSQVQWSISGSQEAV